jgi:hypothetical protein
MAGRKTRLPVATTSEVTVDDAFAELEAEYSRPLDGGERLAIGNNLAGFFALLQEWDLKQQATEEEQPNVSEEANNQEEEEVRRESTVLAFQNNKPARIRGRRPRK